APSEEQLRVWFGPNAPKRFHEARLGCVTGAVSGFVVVDVDPRNGADPDAILKRWPSTLVSRTGEYALHDGGKVRGIQLFFKHPGQYIKTRANALPGLPGIDVKGDRGIVVLPPSPHASGVAYEWLAEGEPAEMPADLLELLLAPPQEKKRQGKKRTAR